MRYHIFVRIRRR